MPTMAIWPKNKNRMAEKLNIQSKIGLTDINMVKIVLIFDV